MKDAFIAWVSDQTVALDVSGGCRVQISENSEDITIPTLCEGGSSTVTWTITDLCDTITVSADFNLTAPEAIVYTEPADADVKSCDFVDQSAVKDAFTAWVSDQTVALNVSGGCAVQISDNNGEVEIPSLCEGGSATVTWTITDLCDTITVSADFHLTAPDAIEITVPSDYTAAAIDFENQEAINTAFASWLEGFGVTGGCDPQGSYGTPSAPTLCGGSVTVTYSVTDLCENDEKTANFTITSPNELVISKPDDVDLNSCDFADQEEVDGAFASWLDGFSVEGGFSPLGEFAGDYNAPALCDGGVVEVTYNVEDECGEGSATATFSLTAPAQVAVVGPEVVEYSSCDFADQDALDAAFTRWLSEFEVTEVGCGVDDPDLSGYSAPGLCEGGEVSVTYGVSDLCSEASISVTFTVTAPADLVYTDPSDANEESCDFVDQEEVHDAFAAWVDAQTVALDVSGGCAVQISDNSGEVEIPSLCEGGSSTVTWTITDLCDTITVSADFNLTAPETISFTDPSDADEESCSYADQDAVNAAFVGWVNAQTVALDVSGGCGVQISENSEDVTIPTLCEGGSATVTWTITDLCDTITVSADFHLTAPDAIEITVPSDYTAAAIDFENQEAINTAFASWLEGFGVTGGCDPQGSYGAPSAPTLCGGSVTVTYSVTDLCENDEKTATFTITSPNELVISKPDDVDLNSCDFADQEEVDGAFASWLDGFSVEGGFSPLGEFAGDYNAPALCDGGVVEVTYNVEDECGEGSVTATFSLTAPAQVAVVGPEVAEYSSCDFADQDALDAAFTRWLSEFEVTEVGCGVDDPDLSGYSAPGLCEGGEVSVTYGVSDLCSEASISVTFTVTAPADLVYTDPSDADEESCEYADQAAVDAAFAAWVDAQTAVLNVSGGCEPQISNNSEEVSIPLLCDGGSATVTWTISDLCETKTVSADFKLTAPDAISISSPEDYIADATDFTDQAAINAAFDSWLAEFDVSGGCAPQGDYGNVSAPTLCGGSVEVTYAVTDLCESGEESATFTSN